MKKVYDSLACFTKATTGITGAVACEGYGFVVTTAGVVEVTLSDGGTVDFGTLAEGDIVVGFDMVTSTANTTGTITVLS